MHFILEWPKVGWTLVGLSAVHYYSARKMMPCDVHVCAGLPAEGAHVLRRTTQVGLCLRLSVVPHHSAHHWCRNTGWGCK